MSRPDDITEFVEAILKLPGTSYVEQYATGMGVTPLGLQNTLSVLQKPIAAATDWIDNNRKTLNLEPCIAALWSVQCAILGERMQDRAKEIKQRANELASELRAIGSALRSWSVATGRHAVAAEWHAVEITLAADVFYALHSRYIDGRCNTETILELVPADHGSFAVMYNGSQDGSQDGSHIVEVAHGGIACWFTEESTVLGHVVVTS